MKPNTYMKGDLYCDNCHEGNHCNDCEESPEHGEEFYCDGKIHICNSCCMNPSDKFKNAINGMRDSMRKLNELNIKSQHIIDNITQINESNNKIGEFDHNYAKALLCLMKLETIRRR